MVETDVQSTADSVPIDSVIGIRLRTADNSAANQVGAVYNTSPHGKDQIEKGAGFIALTGKDVPVFRPIERQFPNPPRLYPRHRVVLITHAVWQAHEGFKGGERLSLIHI